MRGDDRQTDEAYRDDDRHDDDTYDSRSPYGIGAGWGWGWGWPPLYRESAETEYEDDDAAYRDEPYDEEVAAAERAEDDSWLGEGGITMLLVGGVILFVFPEPITSTIGILLIATGVVMWIADALT